MTGDLRGRALPGPLPGLVKTVKTSLYKKHCMPVEHIAAAKFLRHVDGEVRGAWGVEWYCRRAWKATICGKKGEGGRKGGGASPPPPPPPTYTYTHIQTHGKTGKVKFKIWDPDSWSRRDLVRVRLALQVIAVGWLGFCTFFIFVWAVRAEDNTLILTIVADLGIRFGVSEVYVGWSVGVECERGWGEASAPPPTTADGCH